MSACAQLNFNNITPTVWTCVSQIVIEHGGPNPLPPSGSFSKNGYSFSWSYNAGAQTAWIQCTDSPWYVPCSAINSALESTVSNCLQQNGVSLAAFA